MSFTLTKREEEFQRQYEEREKYNLTTLSRVDASGLIFYRPVRGMVSGHFDLRTKHFGTDIAANPNESILAVMDGTVVLSSYTAETGHLLVVQHNQELVSVYKHCGSLLKREGDQVKGGDVVALVGEESGAESGSPYIHFELWHKGIPINPGKYIVF